MGSFETVASPSGPFERSAVEIAAGVKDQNKPLADLHHRSLQTVCKTVFFPSFADGAQFEHDAVNRATIGMSSRKGFPALSKIKGDERIPPPCPAKLWITVSDSLLHRSARA